MASHFEEEGFSLGEKSNRMVTVSAFMRKVKIYILQFYINGNGEMKPGKSGITLEIQEFYELVKLIPQIKISIARYELKDSEIPSSPFQLDLPVIDFDTVFLPSSPSRGSTPIIRNKEVLDSHPKCPSPTPTFLPDVQSPLINPSLENMDDNSQKKRKDKRKNASGPSKKGAKKAKISKLECTDEVASVEVMKEAENRLLLIHCNQLRDKLLEVVRENCTGCQTYETNYLGHELCSLVSAEEQVNLCFEEVYYRVNWHDVMECWHKEVLEMPIALNSGTLEIFKESVNPKDDTYKNRLKKWLIESPIIEV